MVTADTITDDMIRAVRDEARAVVQDCKALCNEHGDLDERIRACNAALGIPTSDGALGTLDQRVCRERIAKIVENARQCGTISVYAPPLTGDTISDADIKALLRDLPTGHYARQWCIDAVSWSTSHPHRQRNARQQCAELINARGKEAK